MNRFPLRRLRDAVDNAEGWEDDIHPDYSGRFMYGETCLAVAADSGIRLSLIAYELGVMDAQEDDDAGRQLLRSARVDSLGRGLILYFPGWQLQEEDVDD